MGDINGDGIPDLIIATSWNVYVIFGTRTGFPDPLPLASLNGSNGFSIYGAGWSVAAGNVNGDGIADIIIGLLAANSPTGSSTYLVFGHRGTWLGDGTGGAGVYTLNTGTGTLIDGIQGVRLDGVTGNQWSVYSVAAGNVNGDGYADVITGMPWVSNGINNGYTYVVFGKKTSSGVLFVPDTTFLPSTTITAMTSGSTSITPASYTGMLVGETLTATGIPAGTTIASCNGTTPPIGTPCISGNPLVLSANATANVSSCGGSCPAPTVATAPLTVGTGTFIDGIQGVRLDGMTAGDNAGYSVAAGDVNGDSIPDLIIGAPNANSYAGYTYVVFGKSTSTIPILQSTTLAVSSSSGTNLTPSPYTDLMVGQTLTATGIPTGTTIVGCNGTPSLPIGTPCTSGNPLVLRPTHRHQARSL